MKYKVIKLEIIKTTNSKKEALKAMDKYIEKHPRTNALLYINKVDNKINKIIKGK